MWQNHSDKATGASRFGIALVGQFCDEKGTPNHKGTIIGVSGAGAFKKRILGMGIVAGTEIENVRSAPLGDPVEYKLKGYCLSLRKSEAKLIEICNVTEAD